MHVDKINVVLDILLKKLSIVDSLIIDNYEEHTNLIRDFINISEPKKNKVIKNGIEEIICDFSKENFTEDINKTIIFKALLIIYSHSNQQQRFSEYGNIVKHFYNHLIQKWIELKEFTRILSFNEYNNIIRRLLPYVKLVVAGNQLVSVNKNYKEGIDELYEVLLYPEIFREDCYEIIRKKFLNRKVTFINFKIEKPQDVHNDYARFLINIKHSDIISTETFLLKVWPNFNDHRGILSNTLFKKESYFYMDLLPKLQSLRMDEILDFFPKCYLTINSRNLIVLEEVTKDGFKSLPFSTQLSYEKLSSVFKQVAKLCSISILLEEKLSIIYNEKIKIDKYFKDMLDEINPVESNLISLGKKINLFIYEQFAELFQNYDIEEFKKQASLVHDKYFEVITPSKKNFNVFTHGRLWIENILFQNDNSKCLLINYDFMKYCSPVFDLQLLLHINADKMTRDKYSVLLLDEFYTNLKINLAKYNVDIHKIYPYEEFQKSCQDVKATAITSALMMTQLYYFPGITLKNQNVAKSTITEEEKKVLEEAWNVIDSSKFKELTLELLLLFNKNNLL